MSKRQLVNVISVVQRDNERSWRQHEKISGSDRHGTDQLAHQKMIEEKCQDQEPSQVVGADDKSFETIELRVCNRDDRCVSEVEMSGIRSRVFIFLAASISE